jgi:hypothetical protein
MGRREARIPSGAKKSTEPPRWGRGGLECPAVSIHNTSEGPRETQTRRKKQHRDTPTQKPLKAKERRQEPKPREDGVPPSGERVAGTGPRREDEMKGGEEVNPSTLRLREPSCIIHRWPHPWHARGGKGGSDFPVRGNRRRGRGRLPARGSSGSPRRRRCGPWPPRRAVSRSSRSRTSGARSGIAAEHRLELVLLADATRCAETSVSSNRVSMDAFAKASGNIAVILRRVGAV